MNENQTYYFTFPRIHPLHAGWIEISAPCDTDARAAMVSLFAKSWASQYEDADFEPEKFPAGRFGEIVETP